MGEFLVGSLFVCAYVYILCVYVYKCMTTIQVVMAPKIKGILRKGGAVRKGGAAMKAVVLIN